MIKKPRPDVKQVAAQVKKLLDVMRIDTTDASVKDTPQRVAKMFLNETCRALYEPPPKVTTFPNTGGDQMVIVRDISFYSMCEHHLVPFFGRCHIAYIPDKTIVGLSKFSRIVQYFAAQPQVQEKLTKQIAEHLITLLDNENVAVVIEAKHLCCAMRGARDVNAYTTTSHLGGAFYLGGIARQEFFNLISKA